MLKIRDKGLSVANITLEQLLTYGRTLEATMQQSKIMGCTTSVADKSVNAVFHDEHRHRIPSRGRERGRNSFHRGRQVTGAVYEKQPQQLHRGCHRTRRLQHCVQVVEEILTVG